MPYGSDAASIGRKRAHLLAFSASAVIVLAAAVVALVLLKPWSTAKPVNVSSHSASSAPTATSTPPRTAQTIPQPRAAVPANSSPTTSSQTGSADAYKLLLGCWSGPGMNLWLTNAGASGVLTTNFGGTSRPGPTRATFLGVYAGAGALAVEYDFTTNPNQILVNGGGDTSAFTPLNRISCASMNGGNGGSPSQNSGGGAAGSSSVNSRTAEFEATCQNMGGIMSDVASGSESWSPSLADAGQYWELNALSVGLTQLAGDIRNWVTAEQDGNVTQAQVGLTALDENCAGNGS